MTATSTPSDVLKVRISLRDLVVLRAACRVAGVKRLESFAAEILESAVAEYRRNKIEPEQGKWDERDRRVFRNRDVDVHRRKLKPEHEAKALNLRASGLTDRAIATRLGVTNSAIREAIGNRNTEGRE